MNSHKSTRKLRIRKDSGSIFGFEFDIQIRPTDLLGFGTRFEIRALLISLRFGVMSEFESTFILDSDSRFGETFRNYKY